MKCYQLFMLSEVSGYTPKYLETVYDKDILEETKLFWESKYAVDGFDVLIAVREVAV